MSSFSLEVTVVSGFEMDLKPINYLDIIQHNFSVTGIFLPVKVQWNLDTHTHSEISIEWSLDRKKNHFTCFRILKQ